MNKLQLASKVVSFWHTIEFLNQDNYPMESKEDRRKVRNEKKFLIGGTEMKVPKVLRLHHIFNTDKDLKEILKEDKELFKRHPIISQNIHICMGKLSRGICVEKMQQLLNVEVKSPEKEYSNIAVMGLQISENGEYVPDTFNLSPIVWVVKQIAKYGENVKDELSAKEYKKDMEKYNKMLIEADELTFTVLKGLLDSVNHDYIKPFFQYQLNYEGVLIYQKYSDEKSFKKNDDSMEDISSLVHSYYTDDLDMVNQAIKSGHYGEQSIMQGDVIRFILALIDTPGQDEKKMDIRADKEALEKCLMPEHLPIGKWPSQYSASLMQQAAVNLALNMQSTDSRIFSVNGPPGTGKTTLLKEIIASTIIERADFLTRYDSPDDAFVEHYFKEGDKAHNGYDKIFYSFYAFKDKELEDYGMLVASNNNAAVENITRDLPNARDLCKGLTTANSDQLSMEEVNDLNQVKALFDLSQNSNCESYHVKLDKKSKDRIVSEKPDIYFSWLAHQFLNNSEIDQEEFNEWGMISVPLGKYSNISSFCYYVLEPLINDFIKSNQKREQRLEQYRAVVNEFTEQMEFVRLLKESIIEQSHAKEKKEKRESKVQNQIQENKNKIKVLKERINELTQLYKSSDANISRIKANINSVKRKFEMLNQLQGLERQKENMKLALQATSEQIIEMEDKLKFRDNIFCLFKKKTERILQIDEVKLKKAEMKNALSILEQQINAEKSNLTKLLHLIGEYEEDILNEEQQKKIWSGEFQASTTYINSLQGDIEKKVSSLAAIQKDYEEELAYMKKTMEMTVLDDDFWNDYDSSEEKKSLNAQLANPWSTKQLDREREKLFYLALQVHKEFVLSSKACRNNYINLEMMWRTRQNKDNETVQYTQYDREQAFGHLLNSLFLFVPVISTTFASVQTFLKDIKQPDKIGMLIVDEAGQASPHIALGSLYRCKKAVIVGDPKQVQPVVTADSDCVRNVFKDDMLQPYLLKTISVQNFADKVNPFGSYLTNTENEEDSEWVGCPLVVHRRCINPMFKISNELCYGNTMKLHTQEPKPGTEIAERFILPYSVWINVKGSEQNPGDKNHFVSEQGKRVCEIVAKGFEKYGDPPDLYIISPFKTVISGMKKMLSESELLQQHRKKVEEWCETNCGTVHTFQGKEAAEVVFLLGCDKHSIESARWVNSNIVNVAVTRAKYRLYVIGDYEVWKESKQLRLVKEKLEWYLECK